ncbi:MAG TPA: histidine kinase dimerization/phospho-acceptor domain-containing protein, partial [Thermodesulfobacteriota bacterium]|nr:histidine kinase dimerization/phospho-acceptor domain-containing protein [Thermodesulfobacteriota bacterium]
MMKSARLSYKKEPFEIKIGRDVPRPKRPVPWKQFLGSMAKPYGPGPSGKGSLGCNVRNFLCLPYSRSVSLFLLNKDTFEFTHHLSCPATDESRALKDFDQFIEQGIIASALTGTDGFLMVEGSRRDRKGDVLIVPLTALNEITGVILVAFSRSKIALKSIWPQLILLQARQIAGAVYNRNLQSRLRANDDLVRQKISGRTQNLEQAQRELRTILDSIKTGIIIIDRQTGLIINANNTAQAITEFPRERLLKSPCQALCPEEKTNCPFCQDSQKGSRDYFETVLKKANGESVPILKTIVPLNLGGQPCLLESFVDIRERKNLENQFFQSQKLEAVGRLAGGVAHDFNNLLMAIMGYCDLTLAGLNRESQPYHFVEEIDKAAERAAALTSQLLALSRKQVLRPRIVDLNSVLTEINSMLLRIIGEDIDLVSLFDPHLGRVRADKGQIEQVVMNLTVNARDAMPQGGRLLF